VNFEVCVMCVACVSVRDPSSTVGGRASDADDASDACNVFGAESVALIFARLAQCVLNGEREVMDAQFREGPTGVMPVCSSRVATSCAKSASA
jgi:hypothetical protein